ncbi:MAG TPA: hypothetical protein VFR06_04625 [Gallionellaceae bacterium]|nr:hypothetical protein [Gallionellaceae bacterium]
MDAMVSILDKQVKVEWTSAAAAEMARRADPLAVEMELYFSCLLRKKVRFDEKAHSRTFLPVTPQLQVAFRPVMTRVCSAETVEDAPPLDDFPIVNPAAFVPHWLKIDYRHGQWQGEFGFTNER